MTRDGGVPGALGYTDPGIVLARGHGSSQAVWDWETLNWRWSVPPPMMGNVRKSRVPRTV